MELGNILFVVAFIVLPVFIGVWALVTRWQLLRRSAPPRETRPAKNVRSRRGQQSRPVAPDPVPPDSQETAAIPQLNASEVIQPIQQVETVLPSVQHRPFVPPRYRGRSGGIVKRVHAPEHRPFLRRR